MLLLCHYGSVCPYLNVIYVCHSFYFIVVVMCAVGRRSTPSGLFVSYKVCHFRKLISMCWCGNWNSTYTYICVRIIMHIHLLGTSSFVAHALAFISVLCLVIFLHILASLWTTDAYVHTNDIQGFVFYTSSVTCNIKVQ